MPQLKNFFMECPSCKRDLRFDEIDQVRDCPQCGKKSIQIGPATKRYLIEQYGSKDLDVLKEIVQEGVVA